MIRSDQESPLRAVVEKLAKERGEAQTVRSPRSNGVVERAIKEVEDQMRIMKSALDHNMNTDIRAESSTLTWMIEFVGLLIRWYLVGKDSKTRG